MPAGAFGPGVRLERTRCGLGSACLPGVTDTRVLEVAYGEGRIVITEDRDFGKLTMLLKLPAIAVVIAHATDFPGSLSEVVTAVADTVEQLDRQLFGQLTTIEPGRIRQRALPSAP